MTPQVLLVLAFALLALPPATAATRLKRPVTDSFWYRESAGGRTTDPLWAAAVFDLLAACLRAGLSMDVATRAVIPSAPSGPAEMMRQACDLMRLGTDPITAWENAARQGTSDRSRRRNVNPDPIAALARAAARSARSGTSMADGIAELAVRHRGAITDAATARGQRAGVLLAGPLGLCFLPAFLCLGIVPVVVGLLGQVLGGGPL